MKYVWSGILAAQECENEMSICWLAPILIGPIAIVQITIAQINIGGRKAGRGNRAGRTSMTVPGDQLAARVLLGNKLSVLSR